MDLILFPFVEIRKPETRIQPTEQFYSRHAISRPKPWNHLQSIESEQISMIAEIATNSQFDPSQSKGIYYDLR